MPFNRSRYPPNWETFTHYIKVIRAAGRCECTGQCGIHQPNPMPRRCAEVHGQPALHFRGRVILTTAHLCKCDPPCALGSHVLAMCQRCHLRVDSRPKAARRAARELARRNLIQPILDDLGATATNWIHPHDPPA